MAVCRVCLVRIRSDSADRTGETRSVLDTTGPVIGGAGDGTATFTSPAVAAVLREVASLPANTSSPTITTSAAFLVTAAAEAAEADCRARIEGVERFSTA